MTPEGYPDDEELATVKGWQLEEGYPALLEYLKLRWRYAEHGYWRQRGPVYKISTAGWSGNEDLMGSLQDNWMFWSLCWVSSRRGGHYVFDLSRMPRDPVP